LTLKNGFKQKNGVVPDDRLENAARIMSNTDAINKLYHPNIDLLKEIERTKKESEIQRLRRL